MADVILALNVDDIVKKYLGGMSELELSQRFNVSRCVIRRRLVDRKIRPRGQSEANKVMASKMSITERRERILKAQAAVRGSHVLWETKCKSAKTRENLRINVSPLENELAQMFKDKGFQVTQQKAVGAYNLDVALERERIAIEVFGGNFHKFGDHKALFFKRSKYLLDEGWCLIFVWIEGLRHPMTLHGRDYLLSLCQKPGLNKTLKRRYWMIWGDGKHIPEISSYFNDSSTIKALCG
jgi:very-short-patch-repair endonuclease